MTAPTATYRLQFRDGMTFARAATLAGYLRELGVSHLYASPLFAAAEGSSHGYDGIDFTAMGPAIGGEEGFDRLTESLDASGLGLLLDFVPNHMAAAPGNRWWESVLEWGAASPHAAVFDIDWSAPRLLLPILGTSFDDARRDGVLGVAFDETTGEFFLTCYDRRLPLTPPSYAMLLARVDEARIAGLAAAFAGSTAANANALQAKLADASRVPGCREAIVATVAAAAKDGDLLVQLHDAQVWQLAHWRLARERLTYRRFFEIADLICLRVEDAAVFEAVHARLLSLIHDGVVDGVRLDHIDGLADPKGYLERLQDEAGGAFYLLVEKILEAGEALRPDWPVAGTTGYEFIALLAGLFVDRDRETEMTRAYDDFLGAPQDYACDARAAKRRIFSHNLAAELNFLVDRARNIAAGLRPDLTNDALRNAIVELAAALPVYRTYVDAAGPSDTDHAQIAAAARDARGRLTGLDRDAVDFLVQVLSLRQDRAISRDDALAFSVRFQQTTGPVMAKGIEDTMFYRYNRLIALNEVGGAPDRYGAPVSDIHDAMAERTKRPGGLSATSTHDTKRGEDARARLYALSEIPDRWRDAVARWSARNAPYRAVLPGGPAPEPAQEWAFYQALVGAWPAELVGENPQAMAGALGPLRDRLSGYMKKAVREAKCRTSWTDPDNDYEQAVAGFVSAVLSEGTGEAFLKDFAETCLPIWHAGAVTSLAQLAIKLAAPGVPDIYQGAELWDVSLVDPDNRRPVDFDARQRLLAPVLKTDPARLLDDWRSGAPKLALTAAGLRLRASMPSLFAEGAYIPLAASGAAARHVVAFARRLEETVAIIVVPRFVLGLARGLNQPLVPVEQWKETSVLFPEAWLPLQMRDLVTGEEHAMHRTMSVSTLLHRFPVALLTNTL